MDVDKEDLASRSQPVVDGAQEPATREAVPSAALWEMRVELNRLSTKAAEIRATIREAEQCRARARLTRLSPHQRAVVAALVDDDWHEEIWFTYRRSIAKMTGLLNDQVGRALGALKRLGFVEFRRGLFTEDGEVAGCGYRVTRDGYAWWWEHEAPAGSAEGVAPTQLREAQQ